MSARKDVISYWSPDQPRLDGKPRRYRDPRGYVRLRWRIGPYQVVEAWEHIWLVGEPGMEVHHVNGIRWDNDRGNLLVLTPEQHQAVHAATQRACDERAVALYLAGLPTPVVGRLMGCDPSTVSRILARNGVRARRGATRHSVDERAIVGRLMEGARVDAVARELELGRKVVDRVRRDHGLPAPSPGRPPGTRAA